MTEYVRDKRSPMPRNDATSKAMRANCRKDTSPELKLRRGLRKQGCTGYRLQWKIPGRPDICFPGKKVAIFVNGCFWHRCPICNLPLPKTNTSFWEKKFERNVERDKVSVNTLVEEGWTVHVIWECEIKNDLETVLMDIVPSLTSPT